MKMVFDKFLETTTKDTFVLKPIEDEKKNEENKE